MIPLILHAHVSMATGVKHFPQLTRLGGCLCVFVIVWQQVDECYRESGVIVDSLRNVLDLCLCVHMKTHTHTQSAFVAAWVGWSSREI